MRWCRRERRGDAAASVFWSSSTFREMVTLRIGASDRMPPSTVSLSPPCRSCFGRRSPARSRAAPAAALPQLSPRRSPEDIRVAAMARSSRQRGSRRGGAHGGGPGVADRQVRGAAALAHQGGVLGAAGAWAPLAPRAARRRWKARRADVLVAGQTSVGCRWWRIGRWWWHVPVGHRGCGGATSGAGVAQAVLPVVAAAVLPQVAPKKAMVLYFI
ncbi:hypothetical protein PAHAL_9G318600 [Panicum hallii]|uniref:Uncharacterized protein n=1 Tax=Panicum hallii TaxID=206008 RepID=A0A2T8I361_9POAL|nr:hypothetical protein PAHAL_9G318600 [Panicum hallii]